MATNWINIKGRAAWVQAYEPDEYSGDKRWKMALYPFDENEWKKFDNSGLMLEKKEDAKGNKFITLRRSVRRVFPSDDEATYFSPPEITGAVNVSYINAETKQKVKTYKKSDKIEISTLGDQKPIGNDSVVVASIAVYDTAKGKGHRWESLNVLDLVEYSSDNKEEVTVPEKKDDMNDSIPW